MYLRDEREVWSKAIYAFENTKPVISQSRRSKLGRFAIFFSLQSIRRHMSQPATLHRQPRIMPAVCQPEIGSTNLVSVYTPPHTNGSPAAGLPRRIELVESDPVIGMNEEELAAILRQIPRQREARNGNGRSEPLDLVSAIQGMGNTPFNVLRVPGVRPFRERS